MKRIIILLPLLFCAVQTTAADKEVPTFTISSQDVVESSIYKFRMDTNKFTVKFQYTAGGSNRARAFTVAHQNQLVRHRIGGFETPPSRLRSTNTSGRDGYWGISEKNANAIVEAVKNP
jgi:hypothetical protein